MGSLEPYAGETRVNCTIVKEKEEVLSTRCVGLAGLGQEGPCERWGAGQRSPKTRDRWGKGHSGVGPVQRG